MSENHNENIINTEINGCSQCDKAPFLSVVMRTQGKRPEALSEVLLCMCGQSEMDFEVLVMGHNLDEKGKTTVLEIIEKLPSYMDGKVRLVEVNGGNRTTPLNAGFKEAKGRYISILDDDDLVLENWVETFKNLEVQNSGKILHAYCVTQDWKSLENDYGETILVSTSKFRTEYCRNFDFVEQFVTNYCPTFSLAFPSDAYKVRGIHFDESLTTTEDWDFLMRTALCCGVADEPVVTGIYRKWINAENSATLHNELEWKKNYIRIQKNLLQGPFNLPEDITKRILALREQILNKGQLKKEGVSVKVYGENSDVKPQVSFEFDDIMWTVRVTNISDFGKVRGISFSPASKGSTSVFGFKAETVSVDGTSAEFDKNEISFNGVKRRDSVIFPLRPKCKLKFKQPVELTNLSFNFGIEYGVIGPKVKRLLLRPFSKAKRILIKIKRRVFKA